MMKRYEGILQESFKIISSSDDEYILNNGKMENEKK